MATTFDADLTVTIRTVEERDLAYLTNIYNHYIQTSTITFEEESISEQEMRDRWLLGRARYPWLVACTASDVLGYAYATAWRTRAAYRHSVESTIYLDPGVTSRGVGSRLYGELLSVLRAHGFHACIGGIAQPNEASVRLHERLGFEKVAHFKAVGFKFGSWIDVAYWQKLLID